jgi:hypothetical protein
MTGIDHHHEVERRHDEQVLPAEAGACDPVGSGHNKVHPSWETFSIPRFSNESDAAANPWG